MILNRDTEAAWRYHNLTKHSYQSIRADRHYLDWSNQPEQLKIYPSIDPIPLPVEFGFTHASALAAIASPGIVPSDDARPTLAQVASILLYSAGVTKEKNYPGGSIYFRAAACAGALYPIETYVVCSEVEDLDAGVYHFNPGDFSVRRLREGDHRGALIRATASHHAVTRAPLVIVYSAISFRSSWKYRDRAYRYHFWDNGMILANALAMATAHRLPAEVVTGFIESDINLLVGIDGQRELAVSLLTLGHANAAASCVGAGDLGELKHEVVPISPSPVDYPSIREMHEASSLIDEREVESWRDGSFARPASEPLSTSVALSPLSDDQLPGVSIEEVIERRGSTRRFARKSISFAQLSTILDRATRGTSADRLDRSAQFNDLYVIVNSVEGLESGAYVYQQDSGSLGLLKPGDFRSTASYLTLGQELGGDASATIFFMADLASILASFGNRGYRAAQLEAGIIGGKVYLAAYSIGRGATGLTFYDDDVTEFFSPHAAGKSCMLVVSVGVPGKRLIY